MSSEATAKATHCCQIIDFTMLILFYFFLHFGLVISNQSINQSFITHKAAR